VSPSSNRSTQRCRLALRAASQPMRPPLRSKTAETAVPDANGSIESVLSSTRGAGGVVQAMVAWSRGATGWQRNSRLAHGAGRVVRADWSRAFVLVVGSIVIS
jgi:hypothetical protein